MKISIITVSFNSAITIERTIKSVISQKNVDLEYFIIDGLSKDCTLKIAENYKVEFKKLNISYHIISEKDNGMYDAMNKGIQLATGEIIGILNSDDYYFNDSVLSDVVNAFKKNNTNLVYGNLLYVKDDKPYRYWKSGKAQTFTSGWMAPHPALFITKDSYEKCGLYRIDCGVNADYELMLRFFEINKLTSYWLDSTLVYMSVGGRSDNGINSRINGFVDNELAWKINDLELPFYTLFLKRLRKLPQFFTAKMIKI